jgi:hypothetical protein
MGTLLAVYAIASAAVSAYVRWLAAGNGRLARRVKRLETLLAGQPINESPHAKVS